MKKIIALVLMLILTCSMMVSCDTPQSILQNADAALKNEPYKVTMTMNIESDNSELNEALSMMNMEIPVTVDGKNIALDMSVDIFGYVANSKIIVADMVMYYDVNMLGQSIKMKSKMSEEDYQEFIKNNNTQMILSPSDFESLTLESKDGKTYISCTDITSDGLNEIKDLMQGYLGDIASHADISNIKFGVTIDDGKYDSMDLSCVISITENSETYSVTLKLSAEFSYDDVSRITAPSDANDYQEMDFEDLIN